MGGDLLSVDVHRGRDHGIPPYHMLFTHCTGRKVRDWNDLQGYFSNENVKLLSKVYESVFDVDVVVGSMLEKRDYRLLGVVARCIASKQFAHLKFGDRFFYSFLNGPDPFTSSEFFSSN